MLIDFNGVADPFEFEDLIGMPVAKATEILESRGLVSAFDPRTRVLTLQYWTTPLWTEKEARIG